MSILGVQTRDHARPPEATFQCDLYRRFLIEDPGRFFAQVLVVPGADVQMRVRASRMALDVDFRTESTRPDVPGRQRPRPGFRLVDKLKEAHSKGTSRILFNGNNVGYWGNQFVVEARELRGKRRGPIFDDKRLADHVAHRFSFFGWSPSGFSLKPISLQSFSGGAYDDTGIDVLPAFGSPPLPVWAVSGFPLVKAGLPVWQEHVCDAWDSRLLFDVGRMIGTSHERVVADIVRRHSAGEPQVRHPLTTVGVDEKGDAIIMVVEQSVRSRGLSIAEAAERMRGLGAVDAIALGAAGDAQLATTNEGFLVAPLVDDHVRTVSPPIPERFRSPELADLPLAARPIPCIVSIEPRDPNADPPVEEQTVMDGKVNRGIRRRRSTGRHRQR